MEKKLIFALTEVYWLRNCVGARTFCVALRSGEGLSYHTTAILAAAQLKASACSRLRQSVCQLHLIQGMEHVYYE